MLYSFLSSLVEQYSFLNVFKYITVRIALSVITSFVIVFLIGEPLIKIFERRQISGSLGQRRLAEGSIPSLSSERLEQSRLQSGFYAGDTAVG